MYRRATSGGARRQSPMVKRERVWLGFETMVVPPIAGDNDSEYVALSTSFEWSFLAAGSQSVTLMGIVYAISWSLTAYTGSIAYAVVVDQTSGIPDVSIHPSNWAFQGAHDILHLGLVSSDGSLTALAYRNLDHNPDGMIRIKARRILTEQSELRLYVPKVNGIIGSGEVAIFGRVLILRHG